MVSFGMSVFWIAVLSFGMVTLVARAGCLIGIDSYTMGLIVIAVGTSIPVSNMFYTIHLYFKNIYVGLLSRDFSLRNL